MKPQPRTIARAVKRVGKYDSQGEADHANRLDAAQRTGGVVWWAHKPFAFILSEHENKSKRIRYTPDFLVLTGDLEMEVHEVKGWWREAALVRVRLAAEKFWMFRWRIFYTDGHSEVI